MKFFNLLLIAILFQSCVNNSKPNKEQEINHSNHDHKAMFLDSIPTKSVERDTLFIDKILINNDTILINRNTFRDINLINSNLRNYALTSDNYLFELQNIKNILRYGKYGCYNNLIFLDTLDSPNCDKGFKYVKLEKVYIHDESSKLHLRSNDTFLWKMNSDQYNKMLALIRKYNNEDKMVNLQMDDKPTDMCMNLKVFEFDKVVPFSQRDH